MSGLTFLLLILLLDLTESPTQNEGQEELEKCASMPEDAARLACFDAYAVRARQQETASLKPASSQTGESTEVNEKQRQNSVVSTKPENAQTEQQETQSSDPHGMPAEPQKTVPESVVARVETFTRLNRSNNIRITLDNGQVWQEIDGTPFRSNVEPGAEVTIVSVDSADIK